MNKSITSLATISAVLFTFGMASQAMAEQGKSTQVTRSNISNNKAAEPGSPACEPSSTDCDDAAAVKSPRDAASGQATGKRQHKPVQPVLEADASGDAASSVASPRDAASGQATGKRQAVAGDGAADANVETSRDAGSGMASGKRQHKPLRASTADVDGDGAAEGGTKAQDHNSSRSNKTSSAVDDGNADGDAQTQTYKAKAGKTGSAK